MGLAIPATVNLRLRFKPGFDFSAGTQGANARKRAKTACLMQSIGCKALESLHRASSGLHKASDTLHTASGGLHRAPGRLHKVSGELHGRPERLNAVAKTLPGAGHRLHQPSARLHKPAGGLHLNFHRVAHAVGPAAHAIRTKRCHGG